MKEWLLSSKQSKVQSLGQDQQVDSFNKLNQVLTNLIHLRDVSAFYHEGPVDRCAPPH